MTPCNVKGLLVLLIPLRITTSVYNTALHYLQPLLAFCLGQKDVSHDLVDQTRANKSEYCITPQQVGREKTPTGCPCYC